MGIMRKTDQKQTFQIQQKMGKKPNRHQADQLAMYNNNYGRQGVQPGATNKHT